MATGPESSIPRAVERVRGFHDVDGRTLRRLDAVVDRLMGAFGGSGFGGIDVPIVEQMELYLRKNGAQVLPKIYGFVDQGRREIALRPEFTASILRAQAARVLRERTPVRVAYSGPVFRYEKPQRARDRQFTQVGVEILGDPSPVADAEILALACRSARDLGISPLRLVIGHLGPLRSVLSHLRVDTYTEQYLLEHLEFFNRGPEQRRAVRQRLGLLEDAVPAVEGEEPLSQSLANAVRDATPEEARRIVAAILEQMGVALTGSTRTPDEIIDRLLAKARRRAAQGAGTWRDDVARAIDFLESLVQLRGAPSAVMARTVELLARYDVPPATLDELRTVLRLLDAHDLRNVQVELAPGMARGIAYYSGLIFEMYAGDGGAQALQICGGGRYDGLAQALTGCDFPALGFAFGAERLLHALPDALPVVAEPMRVALIVGTPELYACAQRAAGLLRERAIACAVYASTRTPVPALDAARQSGFQAAMVLHGAVDAVHVDSFVAIESLAPILAQAAAAARAAVALPAAASDVR